MVQKLLVFACLVFLLFGCGQDEPSLSEVDEARCLGQSEVPRANI